MCLPQPLRRLHTPSTRPLARGRRPYLLCDLGHQQPLHKLALAIPGVLQAGRPPTGARGVGGRQALFGPTDSTLGNQVLKEDKTHYPNGKSKPQGATTLAGKLSEMDLRVYKDSSATTELEKNHISLKMVLRLSRGESLDCSFMNSQGWPQHIKMPGRKGPCPGFLVHPGAWAVPTWLLPTVLQHPPRNWSKEEAAGAALLDCFAPAGPAVLASRERAPGTGAPAPEQVPGDPRGCLRPLLQVLPSPLILRGSHTSEAFAPRPRLSHRERSAWLLPPT